MTFSSASMALIEIDTIDNTPQKAEPRTLSIAFESLGCRLNHAESASLEGGFDAAGFRVLADNQQADIVVVNTCFVTAQAEAKCRSLIRRILKKTPKTFIAVTGCYAQADVEALKRVGGIDLIVGTEGKMDLPMRLHEAFEKEVVFSRGLPQKCAEPIIFHSPKISRDDFKVPALPVLETVTRPNVKIQDGCDFFCTFCIIPHTRGRSRSRDFDDVLKEAAAWAVRGHIEIVLTGVNLGEYDSNGRDLCDLITALEKIESLKRIRLSSIEPTTMPDRLIDLMANSKKLCAYLHLPLQSGCDRILADMDRRYTSAEYRELALKALRKIPNLCLGSDVMVGFPGEDVAAFQDTLSLIQSLPFSYLHVFPYSRREGTRVTRTNLQTVPPSIIKARSATLCSLSNERRQAFLKQSVSNEVEVLFESLSDAGVFSGFTENYLRVGVQVGANSEQDLSGQIHRVRIEQVENRLAMGSLLK